MPDKDPTIKSKTCNACGKHKAIHLFGKNKAAKDGYTHKCKMCTNKNIKAVRKVKDEDGEIDVPIIKLTNVLFSDYVKMYALLSRFGYDITKPIHKQFVSKHKLSYKTRPAKSKNKYPKEQIIRALLDIS
jgi:hypothetical protein